MKRWKQSIQVTTCFKLCCFLATSFGRHARYLNSRSPRSACFKSLVNDREAKHTCDSWLSCLPAKFDGENRICHKKNRSGTNLGSRTRAYEHGPMGPRWRAMARGLMPRASAGPEALAQASEHLSRTPEHPACPQQTLKTKTNSPSSVRCWCWLQVHNTNWSWE